MKFASLYNVDCVWRNLGSMFDPDIAPRRVDIREEVRTQ